MPDSPGREAVQPLFASNARLWLSVWAATQATALIVCCSAVVARAGGVTAFLAQPPAGWVAAAVALIVAYHVAGLVAHGWIMRRPWAVAVYVPLGWAILVPLVKIVSDFSLLILGMFIEGFIFLPFTWAIGALTLVILTFVGLIVAKAGTQGASLTISRGAGMLGLGIVTGTVLLYIDRVNRDAAVRARLLRQLDDAQRDLAARAKEAGVQEERQRLALDIHDTLAQGFASVVRHLEAVELSFASGAAPAELVRGAAPHLAHAQAVSRSSLAEIRRVVWALRPPQLAEATLCAALERAVAHWSEINAIPATRSIGPMPPLLPDADVIFLRATQEALSNVAKHAHASRVSVALHCEDGLALLSVEDDGRGIADADTAGAGTVGLGGMRERVRRFGGHVMVEGAPGSGTSITVAMPLAAIVAAAP